MTGGLTVDKANAVYGVLVAEAGAREDGRAEFVHHQTDRHCSEFRFMGALGFGGKFWRSTGRRSDGSWGEIWYVNTYPELLHGERIVIIDRTNERLEALQSEVQS